MQGNDFVDSVEKQAGRLDGEYPGLPTVAP
ncbi:hypothetical protein CCYS_07290 [Corynebacterium cystitidis DSM 20524]|nr:hypothetical protein CCYS_07290 [Corynebacterium cystitidis DSM 20524]SNV76076.1 Uncharacterised protein [Corynebacterium cystitidis]